jgi:assimilatory nitrate reductase catalytic subunit
MGTQLSAETRFSLLAGIEKGPMQAMGKIVCSCFSISDNAIKTAIRERHCRTPAEIGADLRAGTNCGSCIPELKNLLATHARQEMAV